MSDETHERQVYVWQCQRCGATSSVQVESAEIADLQAIVDKIQPKTADGVPVMAGRDGTELFYFSVIIPGRIKGGAWWDGTAVRCKLITITPCTEIGVKEYGAEISSDGTMPDLSVSDCYSTREAAEKARMGKEAQP